MSDPTNINMSSSSSRQVEVRAQREDSASLLLEHEDEEPKEQQQSKKSFNPVLWIVFTIFVTFRWSDRIFLKDVQNGLQRPAYNLIWANVIWPICIQLMTILMIIGYVLYQRLGPWKDLTYDWKFFLPGNPKWSSQGAVPMKVLALFSIGDQLNAWMSSPPSPFVTLPVQSVMTNMVIAYTAILAYFWIGSRYKQTHIIGILLILISILVQFGYPFLANNCSKGPHGGLKNGKCFASYKNWKGEYIELTTASMIAWYVLFGVSFFPSAFSNVYKQKVLQGRDVDVWYWCWWSGNWQIIWGFCCIPLMWIPLPGQTTPKPSEFFQDLADTLACVGGSAPRKGDETCEMDPPIWFFAIFYFAFNLSFNICLLYLTKAMSANWAQIATVLCLNLCWFFSQFRFLMGDAAQNMGYFDYMWLGLASLWLWTYNLEKESLPLWEKSQQSQRESQSQQRLGSSFGSDSSSSSSSISEQELDVLDMSGMDIQSERERDNINIKYSKRQNVNTNSISTPFAHGVLTSSFSGAGSSLQFAGNATRSATKRIRMKRRGGVDVELDSIGSQEVANDDSRKSSLLS